MAADAVETATLLMRLDPESGTLSGAGAAWAAGRPWLAELTLAEVLALRLDCAAADPDSVPLLEAWLDRAQPGWRDRAEGSGPGEGQRGATGSGEDGSATAGGAMTRAQALAVLGLHRDADSAAVRAAYTRLMRGRPPPMRAGSDWLASRLNEARDTLLRG